MALAAIQASYDDDVEEEKDQETKTNKDLEAEDLAAVITDPNFSVMSKIKLNLTPAVISQVRRITRELYY